LPIPQRWRDNAASGSSDLLVVQVGFFSSATALRGVEAELVVHWLCRLRRALIALDSGTSRLNISPGAKFRKSSFTDTNHDTTASEWLSNASAHFEHAAAIVCMRFRVPGKA
jgi:hypothetical protein